MEVSLRQMASESHTPWSGMHWFPPTHRKKSPVVKLGKSACSSGVGVYSTLSWLKSHLHSVETITGILGQVTSFWGNYVFGVITFFYVPYWR